jgi:hypothetical protein
LPDVGLEIGASAVHNPAFAADAFTRLDRRRIKVWRSADRGTFDPVRRGTVIHRAALVALAGAGCVTARHVGPEVTPASVELVRRENPGASIVVEGIYPPQEDVERAPKHLSVSLVETDDHQSIVKADWSSREFTVQNKRIRGLTVTDHARGALQGAGVGALIAGTFLGIIALVTPCTGCIDDSRGKEVGLAGVYIGLPVLVLTTGIGALVGSTTTYTFE